MVFATYCQLVQQKHTEKVKYYQLTDLNKKCVKCSYSIETIL